MRGAIAFSPWTLPLAIFLGLLGLTGFWGVNLEDGGLLPGLSWRILQGEVPHVDFLSARPAGSAVLHVIDFALPLPLVLSTKVVTLAEFTACGVLFSLFIYCKRLAELSLPESVGVVVAVLVGLHQFPIISFYTIDGLVLVGGAFLLVRRGLLPLRLGKIAFAFGLLGVAATTKQSFWFAPFFVFAWVIGDLAWRRVPARDLLRVAAAAIGAAALAPAAYVAWVGAAGGLHAMDVQMTGTQRVYGQNLWSLLQDPHARGLLLPSLLTVMACVAVLGIGSRRLPAWVDVLLRTIASVVLLRLTLREHLSFNGTWAQQLFWCVAGVTVVRCVVLRRVDVVGAAVAFACWMVTLSYGAPTPALAAGAAVLYLADALWRGAPELAGRRTAAVYGAAAAIAALAVVVMSIHVRTHDDYGVLRGSETHSLGGDLAGVRMDDPTAVFLADARTCVDRYPARWAAVLPEGALADAVYRLRNPFPLDWLWPPDYNYADGRQRVIDAAARTDARGDYLLLFQTNAFPGPNIAGKIQSFIHDPDLRNELVARLSHARRFQCGEFIAFYDPAK